MKNMDKLAAAFVAMELEQAGEGRTKEAAGWIMKGLRAGGSLLGRGARAVAPQTARYGKDFLRGYKHFRTTASQPVMQSLRFAKRTMPQYGFPSLRGAMGADRLGTKALIGGGLLGSYGVGRVQQGVGDRNKINQGIDYMSANFGSYLANMPVSERLQMALGLLFNNKDMGQGIADAGQRFNV